MDWGRVEEKHRQWLKEHLHLTFEEIDEMDIDAWNEMYNNLQSALADALIEDNDDVQLIDEIDDIVSDGIEFYTPDDFPEGDDEEAGEYGMGQD